MREDYNEKALEILKSFQVLEFALKAYIVHSYNIIKHRVGVDVRFEYSYHDIKDDALGALINKFSKLTSDQNLVGKLKQLRDKRNYVAHEAFLATEDRLADGLKDEFVELNLGLDSIQLELNKCLGKMLSNLERHYLIEPQLKEKAL